MLRGQCSAAARIFARRTSHHAVKLSSSARSSSQGPNAPLELDPSLQDLLRDADMALLKHKPRENILASSRSLRELEIIDFDESVPECVAEDEDELEERRERKSARARFGSNGIGSVFLPAEIRNAIERIIDEEDKPRLHEDAKRLFREERKDGDIWHTNYEADYKSRKQAHRHANRDGTAFASVALPAHYSVVYAVLDNVKHRLGNDWQIRNVVEWGSGVGSGLWASMHAFQGPPTEAADEAEIEPLLSQSVMTSYIGLEKRSGLSAMAKRLVEVPPGSDVGSTEVHWRKGYSDTEQVERSEGGDTLALSGFHLSSLPNPMARKEMVKQMWSSGADVIILIDHDTSAGFECIAEAREQLLRMGRRELEDTAVKDHPSSGCHVIAPCPHDGACPLFHSGKASLKCTFSQRLQRPAFLRKTKNVKAGHEDIGYSYVVIKRGKRPSVIQTKSADEGGKTVPPDIDSTDSIRLDAYNWPRMVFPPLKKNGHVIIDGCTVEGKIMRMTIPRSQGKQPYYDARKSSWGDIFPHKPKNPPQIRLQSTEKTKDPSSLPGSDIGKRRVKQKKQDPLSYQKIYTDLKESRKDKKREWNRKSENFED